uniref:Aminotransferase class V domain-containing protein n=1 Tax=Oryza barthii TaxID=65489 RepID=A0A0D3HJG8_9ORYZ
MDGGGGGEAGVTTAAAKATSTATLLSLLRAKSEQSAEAEEKVEWVRSQLVGAGAEFDTPFGRRPLVYADHTASGRGLRYVEDYVLHHVLPFYGQYHLPCRFSSHAICELDHDVHGDGEVIDAMLVGNTHTEDSYVGSRTTRMARKAASYIKRCVGAGGAAGGDVALLFCGSGATAAVGAGDDGLLDLAALRRALRAPEHADRPMLGSFSACSNVTGVLTDTRAVARLLHQHGAFACFDFAASGPYVEIDMRPGEVDGYDAVFLSPHKFARGGCACAGPYGHALLGVGDELSLRIRAAIVRGYHGVKPGWTRVSFAYYLSGDELRYVLAAIDFVAAHGHRFLPLYAFDWATGDWSFRRAALKRQLMARELLHCHLGSSSATSSDSDGGEFQTARKTTAAGKVGGDVSADKFEGYLERARRIARSLPDTWQATVTVPEGIDPDIVLFRV